MFNKFKSTEKRYVLELINSIAQIDGTFSDEEGCILSAIAYLMEIDLEIWRPNLVDVSLSYSRVGKMSKDKIVETIILLMQVSIFDGLVKYEELSTILPLAYEAGITDDELLDYGRRAFSGDKFTSFDKLLVYALCVKMMEVDFIIDQSEKRVLSKIQEKYNLPPNFIDRQLVNNIDWALNIMSGYSLKKRYSIIEKVTQVRDSDGYESEHEAKLLYRILNKLGLKEYSSEMEIELLTNVNIINDYNSLVEEAELTWLDWLNYVMGIYYEQFNPEMEEYLLKALNEAFDCGLTLEEDLYYYLEAKRIQANILFNKNEYDSLNIVLSEIQNLDIIPKWYWSLLSKLDFDQLHQGILFKNERLLSLVKNYSKYGDSTKVNLLVEYRKFIKKYKDYTIEKHKEHLEMDKVMKITGFSSQHSDSKNTITQNEKKYKGKILILGGYKTSKNKYELTKVAESENVYAEIIIGPNYHELKNYDIKNYENSTKYDCIFIAQSPHSGRGIGESNSIVHELKKGNYPPCIELRTKSNKLFLTLSAFRNGIINARKLLPEL